MNPQNIPLEMQALSQWVCWKYEDRGDTKPTKVPYTATTNTLASVSKPETWLDFKSCVSMLPRYDGLGFVLQKNDPYTIVDLDHTENKSHIVQQVQISQTLDSYSEISPSGKGLHIVVKAKLTSGKRRGPFEFYSDKRFMTCTGNVYVNKPIAFAQIKIESILQDLGLVQIESCPSNIDEPQTNEDFAIYEIASRASNGQKFLSLWNGDAETFHFGDQSRADFAIIDILAFYTKCRAQIKRMFLMCGLGKRPKAKREDYVNNMIDRSFDNIVQDIDISAIAFKPKVEVTFRPEVSVDKPIEIYAKAGALSVPPGLTGQIANFVYQQSHKAVAEMSIVAALGLMAGIAGRAFNVSNTGLNLYLLLLARTGRGKEEMAKGIGKITAALSAACPHIHDFEGPGDLASGQALLRYFTDHRTNSFISVFGEFGLRLKTISKTNASAPDLMLMKVLLDLYNKSGRSSKMMPTAYSDAERNTQTIHSPAFSMIGESTPDWFYDNVDEAMISSGLLPRFAVVEYLGKRPRSNVNAQYAQPAPEMLDNISTLISVSQGLLQAQQRCDVSFDPHAQRLSEELDIRADDQINSADNSGLSTELWNRAHLKTLRIAAILAVGKNCYNPVIDVECWVWAENFVLHGVESMKMRFDGGMVGSNTEQQQVNSLIEILKSYTDHRPQSEKITDDMYNRGCIPVNFIATRLRRKKVFMTDRRGPAAAVTATIKILIESGNLAKVSALSSEATFGVRGEFLTLVNGDMSY